MTNPAASDLTLYYHSMSLRPVPGKQFHDDVLSYSLRKTIDEITELYIRDFFPKGSIVWVNGDMPEAGMHALTDKSSHIRTYSTPRAGWCRITRTSVRFAARAQDTGSKAVKSFALTDHDMFDIPHSTIVVSYVSKDKPLQFQVDGTTKQSRNGVLRWDPFTVIDLPNHKARGEVTENHLELADAHRRGFELMTLGCSDERREFAYNNYDTFKLELKDNVLRGMADESSKTTRAVDLLINKISDGMHKRIMETGDSTDFADYGD